MELMIIVAVFSLIWVMIGPIFGLVAMSRANRLEQNIVFLRAELSRLRDGLGPSEAPPSRLSPRSPPNEAKPQSATAVPPTMAAEARPTPLAATPSVRAQDPSAALPPARRQPVGLFQGRDWERLIAANWIVWVGGLALALGGIFLVRIAIEAGLFGPLQRTLAAGVLGLSLIGLAFRAQSVETIRQAENNIRFLPHLIAGAGIITLFGTVIASGLLYQFVSPLTAFAMLVAVSALSVWLSLRFGPVLAVPGLVGAYTAPLLTGSEGGSVLPLLPYFAVVTGAGLALVRLANWRWLSWILLAGAGFWGVVASQSVALFSDPAVHAYALSLGLMGLAFGAKSAWQELSLPNNGVNPKYIAAGLDSDQLAAHLFWWLTGGLILLRGLQNSVGTFEPGALALYGGIGLLAAWRRPGYALLAPISAAISLISLTLWTLTEPPLVYALLAGALGFGVGGFLLLKEQKLKAPLAITSALFPPAALFIAFWREGGLAPHFGWGIVALFIAFAMGAALEHLRRLDPEFKLHPGAGAAYALGALLSLGLAPFLVLSGFWLGTAFGLLSLAIALVHTRFTLGLVRLGGMAAAALCVGLLVRPGLIDPASVSEVILLNTMTAGFALAIGALYAASRIVKSEDAMRQAYEAGALILSFTLMALTIRHSAGAGQLNGPFQGMGEASAYAIAYLGMAVSLAWRLSARHWIFKLAEYAALLIGSLGVFVALMQIGLGEVGTLPLINLLTVAFAFPALLLAVYGAVLRQRNRTAQGNAASLAAMFLGFLFVSLEVARGWGGPSLATFYGDFGWVYSPAWIAYAFALLFWGVLRRRPTPRYVSLGILLLAIAKVFLIDMGALEGAARAGSFIGLGLSLMGVALFYQRFVFALENKPTAPD